MATMQLDIITAERLVYSEEVEALVAPGIEGQLGILPRHAPMMTVLEPGEIMIRKGGQETYLVVGGGFLEVLGNKLTILADTAERSEEIDEARAQAAMQRAQEQISRRGSQLEMESALATLHRAQARVGVARRRRTRGPRPGGGPQPSV